MVDDYLTVRNSSTVYFYFMHAGNIYKRNSNAGSLPLDRDCMKVADIWLYSSSILYPFYISERQLQEIQLCFISLLST